MTSAVWIIGLLLAAAALTAVLLYNGLVTARQRVHESASTVETELKRRHDLIPNLVAAVKGYMAYERDLLNRLVELREQAERARPGPVTAEQVQTETALSGVLAGLRARFEAYPELKASVNFQSLQAELANTEDRVQGALRFYNGNVRELNIKCESFPSAIVAGLFGFRPGTFFELEQPSERQVPVVEL